jgi:uncharacterized protein (UPF0332 family)
MHAARRELEDAEIGIEHSRHKLATTSSYYAMFHAARALVLAQGYAEKSHYCLGVALEALYGDDDEGLRFSRALASARTLREHADYQGDFSEESATGTRDAAVAFVAWAAGRLER